jgi:predicted AAA+ superfamily ATPase
MITRAIYPLLASHLHQPEITVITGPRQVGKTTLMKMLADSLQKQGQPVLFLHLDNEDDFTLLESQNSFIGHMKQHFADRKGFAFIDEMQLKPNAGLFLKGIYDMELPVKFIISGSGSMELTASIQESMAGRKRVFEVMPVSFFEFVRYRLPDMDALPIGQYLTSHTDDALRLLNEYLNFGGYPRVVLAPDVAGKLHTMDEIFQSYMVRDIQVLLKGHAPEAYARMISLLAAQTGGLINFSSLASDTGVALATVRKYLWYAERTFFLKMLPPLYGNRVKEITKSPVVYFVDHGMRNYAIRMFGNIHNHRDYGFVFQNLVAMLLYDTLQRHIYDLHFWRTTNKAEVDFVVQRYENPLPVEVKYSFLKQPEISRSLRSFLDHYHPSDAWVINLGLSSVEKIGQTSVHFIPLFNLEEFLRELRTEPETLWMVSEAAVPYFLQHPAKPERLKKKSLYSGKSQ